MKRLIKKSNNVSPKIHQEVEKQITNPDGNTSKILLSQDEFLTAKRLLADLPIVPTSERVYELCQDIHAGLFDDISSVEEAMDHWDEWLKRTRDALVSKNILIS